MAYLEASSDFEGDRNAPLDGSFVVWCVSSTYVVGLGMTWDCASGRVAFKFKRLRCREQREDFGPEGGVVLEG